MQLKWGATNGVDQAHDMFFRVIFVGFISIDPISSNNWLGCSKKLTCEQCSVQRRVGLIIRGHVSNMYIYIYTYNYIYIYINQYIGEYHNLWTGNPVLTQHISGFPTAKPGFSALEDETGRAAAELGKRIAGFPGTDGKTVVLATVQLGLIMVDMLVDRLIDRAFFLEKNGSDDLKSLMGFVFFLCLIS